VSAQRDDEDLRALSVHVYWHVRQLCRLGEHIEARRRDGETVLSDALDAAALEAFLVHGRALADFIWRPKNPWTTDGWAAQFFDGSREPWPLTVWPPEMTEFAQRVGWGFVHVTYRPLDSQIAWGWGHLRILGRLAGGLLRFAEMVDPERVAPGFKDALVAELGRVLERNPGAAYNAAQGGELVGTPPLLRLFQPDD
jgi:hypothetical protein